MEVDKIRLIEEIRKRPLLWDFRHFYESRNNKKIDELWQEVALVLDTDSSSCKLVWQKLRTAFFNELKRIPERVAKAKRNGTYDPSKKYNTCPFFDALRFVACGRSVRGVHNQSLHVFYNIKCVDKKNSGRKESQKVKNNENFSLSNENNKTNDVTIKFNSHPQKCSNLKSLYTEESECKKNILASKVNDKFTNHEHDSSIVSKPELSFDSANPKPIIEQTEWNNTNQNQSESESETNSRTNCQIESVNTCILNLKKEPENEFEINNSFANKEEINLIHENIALRATTPEMDLCNANSRQVIGSNEGKKTQLFEGTVSISIDDSCDLDYKFLYSLVPRLKQMPHLKKLEFRAKMSSLMLDIFSSSSPIKGLDKRVLLGADNDPDEKFLISFLPFLNSMPLTKNLQFRNKIDDLVTNILNVNKFCCMTTPAGGW